MQWNAHLPGVGLLVREQHQHARGRLAPLRLPLGADAHDQPLRALVRPPQGEGQGPRGRGHPRRSERGHLGQADRPAVRGPDEDQARQPGHAGLRRVGRQREAVRVPRGEPEGSGPCRPQGRGRLTRPRRRAQGARHRAQERDGRHGPARQARRLHGQGARDLRDLHRRGRLRRRFGQAGPRPLDAGGAAAARQDPQRREVAHRQGAPERRDPGADHRARHRHSRRVRHREAALPQDHPDDGRRRGRRAHPHADPHAAVPRDAGPRRGRPHLHRQAAALQAHPGPPGALHREGLRAREHPARRQARALRRHRRRRQGRSSSPTCAGSASAAT